MTFNCSFLGLESDINIENFVSKANIVVVMKPRGDAQREGSGSDALDIDVSDYYYSEGEAKLLKFIARNANNVVADCGDEPVTVYYKSERGASVNEENKAIKFIFVPHETISVNNANGGNADQVRYLENRVLGAKIQKIIHGMKCNKGNVFIMKNINFAKYENVEDFAPELAQGMELSRYKFNKYFNRMREKHVSYGGDINIYIDGEVHEVSSAASTFNAMSSVAKGNIAARELINEPGNELYPETFAKICEEQGEKLGFSVKVLGEKEMSEQGMGAFMAVSRGSDKEGKMVIMEWKGGGSERPIALVGKGVTFDTGGINLKPTEYISGMKYDMGGAASVYGAMVALASRKAKVNVVAILACAENMPSGNATRPGDIVTSMSGQTIEIDNTDAEGRLVLCDAIWYAYKNFAPKVLIDLATLTGAISVALGDFYGGLFSNDDDLSEQLINAGKDTGEMLWRMPLHSEYNKQINSSCADMQNVGQRGRGAGAITAAEFLHRFIRDEKISNGDHSIGEVSGQRGGYWCKWAHIDIAGVSKRMYDDPVFGKASASGFGVMLLDRWIRCYQEEN